MNMYFLTGFCVKSYTRISKKKYFLNICTSDGIPPPEDISVDQLTTILSSETPNSYKIPMSITELRKTTDKSGQEATVGDVAIHPNFFKKIQDSSVFCDFFMIIVFEALDKKYNVQINNETWVIFKNRKCMGTLEKHRVQNRDVKTVYQSYQNSTNDHKNFIEDLENSFEPKQKHKGKSLVTELTLDGAAKLRIQNNINTAINSNEKTNANVQRKPLYRLFKRVHNAKKSHIVGEFYLPEISSASECNVFTAKNRFCLHTEAGNYFMDMHIEHDLILDQTYAAFNAEKHVRFVTSNLLNISLIPLGIFIL